MPFKFNPFTGTLDQIKSDLVAIRNSSTGVLDGGVPTANVDTTKADLTAGTGQVVDVHTDPNLPTLTPVSWAAQTAVTIDALLTNQFTNFFFDSTGALIQKTTFPDAEELRDLISVGGVFHPGGVIIQASTERRSFVSPSASMLDLFTSLGTINASGNVYSGIASGLTVLKSSGSTAVPWINYNTNKKKPHEKTDIAVNPSSFFQNHRDGAGGFTQVFPASSTIPLTYDDDSGTPINIPNNRFTVHRLYWVSQSLNEVLALGQNIYKTIAEAESSIFAETFEQDPLTTASGSSFRAWLIIKAGTTDMTSATDVKFVTAGPLGSISSAGGSTPIATQDLQITYDNSTIPQIEVDATLQEFVIKAISAQEKVFATWNDASTETMNINGETGDITTTGDVTTVDLTFTGNININAQASATIALGDEILFGDVSDSNDTKKDTVQGIIDLASVAGFDVDTIMTSQEDGRVLVNSSGNVLVTQ